VFGLGWPEILMLVVIALLVFGPEKLPQAAQQAARALRELRRLANNAKADLRSNLGPEFADFDPADLHPRNFVRKHLLDDLERDWNATPATAAKKIRSPRSPSSGWARSRRTTPRRPDRARSSGRASGVSPPGRSVRPEGPGRGPGVHVSRRGPAKHMPLRPA